MTKSMSRYISIGLLAVLIPATLLAQSDQKDPALPTIKTNVRQVLVPVIVTDRSGHYVMDLGIGDFSVYEDDLPQTIVAFSRSAVATTSISEGTDVPITKSRRLAPTQTGSPSHTYLICIDTLHSGFDNFARVRKALKEFFSHEEPGDSQYALFALGRELHVLMDSTRNPSTILDAIESKDLLKTIRDSEAVSLAKEVEQFDGLVAHWCGGCQCTSVEMDMAGPGCPGYKAQVRASLLSFSERAAILNDRFLAQLTRLVNAMTTMPTKRTVLFISDGFNRYAGQELTVILRAYDVNDPSLRFNPRDLQPEVDALLRLAVRDNVRFYALDSRGLYTRSVVPGTGEDASSGRLPASRVRQSEVMVAWQNSDFMAEVAKTTGGAFFENSNDLLKGIRRAFADGREEYVLAYVPTNTAYDGKFRQIRVKVNNKNVQVSAKERYWANP
jgi:VWFA-related protein